MSSYNKKRFNSPIVAVNKAEVNVIGRFKEVQELGLFDTRIRDVLTDGVNFNLNELISELDSKGFTQSTFTPEQVRSQI